MSFLSEGSVDQPPVRASAFMPSRNTRKLLERFLSTSRWGRDVFGPLAFRGSRGRIARFPEPRRPARMDRVREHFPRAADAVLYVSVQHRILRTGIGCLHRVAIAQQPRLAFLDGNPEQRPRARIARIQHVEQFPLECHAVPAVQIYHYDDRGGKSDVVEAPSVALQYLRQSIQKDSFLRVRDAAQILRYAADALVAMDLPRMHRSVRAEDFSHDAVERNASRFVFDQNFKMHEFISGRNSRCTRGRQAAILHPPWPSRFRRRWLGRWWRSRPRPFPGSRLHRA